MSGLKKYATLVGLMTSVMLSYSGSALAEDDIVVGAATSLSGWMAAFDTNTTRAAQMAVDDINAKGGLLGHKLRFEHIDTKTDPAETARAGQQLVAKGAKMIMVACDFDMGAPAALAAQRAGVIAISPCGADMKLGNFTIGNNVFTMATDSAATGRILADWAYKKKNWRTAYVLLDTFIQYDKSLCAGFTERFKELAGAKSIVLADEFKNADVSVASQVSRYQALATKPDMMMLCSVPPGLSSAIRQFRSAGISIPIVAGTGGDGTAWYSAVPGLSDYFVVDYSANEGVTDPRPDAQAFFKAYKAQYGSVPNSGQGITGYSAIQGWAEAVKKAGSFETDKVRAAMETFKDQPLAGGLATFTDKLHTSVDRPMLIMEVTNDEGKALGYYDMRKGDFTTWW
jgi:branched-chain amino acid transport system substrate-binding protein